MTIQKHNPQESPPLHLFESGEIFLHQEHYVVRRLSWDDDVRQREYQQLRAEMLVNQLKWALPLDAEGREKDRYDLEGLPQNGAYCIYGHSTENQRNYLLCGLRLFQLCSWEESMIPMEFSQSGMIPDEVIQRLKSQYDCLQIIEMNRTCLLRNRRYFPPRLQATSFNMLIARDLAYACASAIAEKTQRKWILGIVHPGYLKTLQRCHFILQILYECRLEDFQVGYALIIVDIPASLRNIERKGDLQRLQVLLTFCEQKDWIKDEKTN